MEVQRNTDGDTPSMYVPVNIFLVMLGRFPGLNQYYAMKMKCLAQAHNIVSWMRSVAFSLALYHLS